ncbi:MAG: DHH family phosphoesterase [Rikenellaceae bacterium]
MENIFTPEKLSQFNQTCQNSERIAIVAHTNPDGDAVGSSLALYHFLVAKYPQKHVRVIVPNNFPDDLKFIDPQSHIEVYMEMIKEAQAFLAACDAIICVDFNQISRLDQMGEAIEMNLHATRILIDHHIDPPHYDLAFHYSRSSSAAFLVYGLIVGLGGVEALTPEIASALYLGIMTDTGGFSFSLLDGELFRSVATLVDCGADPVYIRQMVFDRQSEDRLRMVGYLLSQKMVIHSNKGAAYITLTNQEKLEFNHQIGDTEGVVNMPLTIGGITFSAIMIQTKDYIKLSLRSQGDCDVNVLARDNFSGGGHKNAAGGKYYGSMEQCVEFIERLISEF